jgi:hypothetical protein
MRCDAADGLECLNDHIRPFLHEPRPNTGRTSYRAVAPCHPDTDPSLSVTWLEVDQRLLWNCFACSKVYGTKKAQTRTRTALIRSGVSPRCLPQSAEDAADFQAAVLDIVFGKDSHPHAVLKIAALLRGFGGELPVGAELRALAEDCGVSLREAYRARGLHR